MKKTILYPVLTLLVVAAGVGAVNLVSDYKPVDNTPIVMPTPASSIEMLLNGDSYELTDNRLKGPDGYVQYDEICMSDQHLRLIFWAKNRENLVLEYFPPPPPQFPFSKTKWSFEQECPTAYDVASYVGRDSNGRFSFKRDANGHLDLITDLTKPALDPQKGIIQPSRTALYARLYFDGGAKPVSEDVRFLDQTPQKIATPLADGSREETYFYANNKVSRHRITDKDGVVTQDEAKSVDGFPTSTMVRGVSNTLTTTFDADKHLPLWQDNNRRDGQNSTITAFVSGTTKVRMKADYNFIVTSATYFRDDDTIDHVVTVNPTFIQVAFMDSTGKVELFDQIYSFERGFGNKIIKLVLVGVKDLDAKGNVTAMYKISADGKSVQAEQRSNVTVNGVTYPTANYLYRADGTLSEVQYVPSSGSPPPVEAHAQSEGLKSGINVDEFKATVIDAELPVPPPQVRYFGGFGD